MYFVTTVLNIAQIVYTIGSNEKILGGPNNFAGNCITVWAWNKMGKLAWLLNIMQNN